MNIMKLVLVTVLAASGGLAHAENWTLLGETPEKLFVYADKDSVKKNGDIGKIIIRTPEKYLLAWEFDCAQGVILERGRHTSIEEDPIRKKAFDLACSWSIW